jgi:ribosomal protein S18 acetylase RimI-like enzyme
LHRLYAAPLFDTQKVNSMETIEYVDKTGITVLQWQDSAKLISRAIPNAIVSKLGVKFNAIFYRSIAESECSCAYVAHDSAGGLLGIIIGALDRDSAYSTAVKNNRWALLRAANIRLLSPAVVLWIIKGFVAKLSRNEKIQQIPARPRAELVVIAVQAKMRGVGIAPVLVAKMEEFFRSRRLEGPYMILTEESNARSNKFYSKIGCRFITTTVHHGRRINEWHKFLS